MGFGIQLPSRNMSLQQKLPLARSLPKAIQGALDNAFQKTGQALPCSVVSVSGAIVTVKFEVNSSFTLPNITIPLAGAEYIRYPIQVGDKGYVVPAAARLSGMSDIGGGVADLSQPANLTAMVFFPFGNAKWSSVDSQAVVIYGPNGVALRDTGNASNITLTPAGIVMTAAELQTSTTGNTTMTAAAFTLNGPVTINGKLTVNDNIETTGTIDADGEITSGNIGLTSHKHGGVMSGGSETSQPVP